MIEQDSVTIQERERYKYVFVGFDWVRTGGGGNSTLSMIQVCRRDFETHPIHVLGFHQNA